MIETDYSKQMIAAYVAKPDKVLWYEIAFEKFDSTIGGKLTWKWSWWAFFGGFLYLLYRKAYIPSLVLFIVSIFIGFIPFGGLLLAILAGGFAPFYVYKNYQTTKNEIERVVSNEEDRIKAMEIAGGYNQWIIWVYGIFVALILLYIVSMGIAISAQQL